jgi:hypothetical protein
MEELKENQSDRLRSFFPEYKWKVTTKKTFYAKPSSMLNGGQVILARS